MSESTNNQHAGKALWAGRFSASPEVELQRFGASLPVDQRLWREDIAGSKAHAAMLVAQGVISAEDIDSVMKYGLGFRWACIGPVETLDFGGLDVFYHISQYLIPDLCDSHEVPELLKKHFEAGEYGVKNGKGFYDYPPEVRAAKTRERDEKLKKLGEVLG